MPYEPTLEELDGLAGKAANVALARLRIRLDKRREEDLHDYLVELGVKMATEYDPDVGQAFSTWFYRRARQRVIDWLRRTHGDPRYGAALARLPVTYPEFSVECIVGDSPNMRALTVEEPERDSLADAIVELGRDLSPDARWALVNIAGRMAQGATEKQALQESKNGFPYAEAKRRLEVLREELARGKGGGASCLRPTGLHRFY